MRNVLFLNIFINLKLVKKSLSKGKYSNVEHFYKKESPVRPSMARSRNLGKKRAWSKVDHVGDGEGVLEMAGRVLQRLVPMVRKACAESEPKIAGLIAECEREAVVK